MDSMFKEYSLQEMESVKDQLASDIQKKTEQLKSIVKDKYRDVVENSDAIKTMKLNMVQVEKSLWELDKHISDFYVDVRSPQHHTQDDTSSRKNSAEIDVKPQPPTAAASISEDDCLAEDLVRRMSNMWLAFDSEDLRDAVANLNELNRIIESKSDVIDNSSDKILKNLVISIGRAKTIIKNHLWHKIKTAGPDQICVIGGSDQTELYSLALSCSMELVVERLSASLSDMSYHAQIHRYQPPAYFNRLTNQVEPYPTDTKLVTSSHVAIPRQISPELSNYLFGVCEMINKIAGFHLNRHSIVHSLRVTIEQILQVYYRVLPLVESLAGESKRKRALQLHYDLLYVRILLNTSKEVELIEQCDPQVHELGRKYELMLDPVEHYVISDALHENVKSLSKSTIRLYGLLIPHLH